MGLNVSNVTRRKAEDAIRLHSGTEAVTRPEPKMNKTTRSLKKETKPGENRATARPDPNVIRPH